MALSFNPPEWLIQEYINQQNRNPIVEGLQGVAGVAKEYGQQKLQKQELENKTKDRKIAEFNAMKDYLPEGDVPGAAQAAGLNFPSQPPVLSTGTVPSPTAGVPDVQGTPITQAPSLIDRWNQRSIPTSKAGLAKYKTGLETQKLQQELNKPPKGPLQTVTKRQAIDDGTFDPTKQMIVDPSQETQGETRQERLGSSLRKELTSSKPYQNLTMAKAAADNIAQAVKDPGAYGDLATLFDYMKSLDPISVVREGEQETFRKTGSFTQSMANTMNKLVNGQTITPEQRTEILKYTQNRLKTSHNVYKNHSEPTLRQAKRIGADPLEVDPFYDQNFEHLIGADTPAPVSGLAHLSTKELMDLRKKMTAHEPKQNGN